MHQPPRPTPDLMTLLRGVSRSFYLSIRLLPGSLRRPVAVAYLLARAADTLADTAELPAEDRQAMLEAWAGAIAGTVPAAASQAVADTFAPLQHDIHERRLITELPQCLSWLDGLAPADREDVRTVLGSITRGQLLDIGRFSSAMPPRALATAEQLHEYTYLVAGCVGEFWTELGFRHLPGFASLPRSQMRELGRQYGMGLQLVNILRDAGADLAAGRCYFPAAELAAAGIEPGDIVAEPDRFEAIWQRWRDQAQQGLDAGLRYAEAVHSRRMRAASAIPALLGTRTLALLRAAGSRRLEQKLKIPRSEVRWVMSRLAFSLAGRAALRESFRRAGWDNSHP